MKNLIKIFFVACIVLSITACSNKTESQKNTTQNNEQNQTTNQSQTNTSNQEKQAEDTKTELTVTQIIDHIGKKVKVKDIKDKAASMIGAEIGKMFTVGNNTFEIYKFSDESKVKSGKSGTFQIHLEGYGDIESKSSVNGKFILLYETADNAVINAFLEAK